MKTVDNGTADVERGTTRNVERGLQHDQQLRSWSSYLPSTSVQFRNPDYGKDACVAPDIEQGPFVRDAEFRTEHRFERSQAAMDISSPRRLPSLVEAMYNDGNITPGILRPEENHNSFGRCHHKDNRYHNILDTACLGDLSRRPSESDEHDLQSAVTLVASPTAQALFDKYQAQYATHQDSTSSCSSFSSQASDVRNAAPTNRLIRYYTDGNSFDEEILTKRVDRFSTEIHPWPIGEDQKQAHYPLTAHHFEKLRQGSLPPPYQQTNRKASDAAAGKYKPHSKQSRDRYLRHAAHTREKHTYLLKLCKGFLLFGIQAHRLEEYLHITALHLGIAAEFQYIPRCMLIILTHPYYDRSEVHLLKESTGFDLGKLEDVYQVYHAVVEEQKDLQIGIGELDNIMRRRKTYTNVLLILLHGLAAMCAGTFAFSARPVDFAPLYTFGCLLAILQLLVIQTPIRNSHILEVLTSIIVTFSARGLGSILLDNGSPIFCFSGIVQGTIALILPGHIILAATHEIQNRQVLSGTVKMIYAILYTLFLGFGILIGTTLFGFIDPKATSKTTCDVPWYWDTLHDRWRATYAQFVWVPVFALAISIMHQAKPQHLPAMVFIATCGHQAFYWSLSRFAQNLQFAGLLAAFASGLLANIYALFANCLAATVLLPAVLVHIPNALAASGSLVAGVSTADAIVTNTTQWVNDDGMIMQRRAVDLLYARDLNVKGSSGSTGLIITSGIGMAQATIGIVVGLFLSAFVVYPFRRRKAGALAF
ncbi:pheromone-regulated protein prm10 [Lithohypha guttulata]|nr:pheromone-regulated protein prm10 [Lithohypha guttulata]